MRLSAQYRPGPDRAFARQIASHLCVRCDQGGCAHHYRVAAAPCRQRLTDAGGTAACLRTEPAFTIPYPSLLDLAPADVGDARGLTSLPCGGRCGDCER